MYRRQKIKKPQTVALDFRLSLHGMVPPVLTYFHIIPFQEIYSSM